MIKILIAEDHALVREGLRNILAKEPGFQVVGEADNGLDAVEKVERDGPDVMLLDLTLPRLHGLEVLGRLRNRKRTKVMVVSMHADAPSVLEALRLGARGYLLKESPSTQLLEGIKKVHEGGCYVSSGLESMVKKAAAGRVDSEANVSPALSKRERQVLQKLGAGLCSKDIGRELGISPATVGKHRASIKRKIGARNQTEMMRYALLHQLIEA